MFLRIVNVSAKNIDINSNYNYSNNSVNSLGLCNSNIVFAPKNTNFKALKCDTYWRAPLKEGDAYVKKRRIMQMKFQNLVIVSFQITINSCYYDIYSHIFHNY